VKAWDELREKWGKLGTGTPFPVPEPQEPSVRRAGRVPTDPKRHDEVLATVNAELDIWDVCRIEEQAGKPRIEPVRHDSVQAKREVLGRAYVQALLGYKAAIAALKPGEKPPAEPFRPTVKVLRDSVGTKADADRAVQKLEKQAQEAKEKEAEKLKTGETKPPETKPGEQPPKKDNAPDAGKSF